MFSLKCFAIIIALYILTQLTPPLVAYVYVKFTNIKCVSYDKAFADFRYCKLKALSPNKVALFLHVQLFQLPVNNVSINLDVYRKANGYRPFLFNKTSDFCQFLRNPKRIPLGKILMDIIAMYSNINHTCPYNHDIIVKDFILTTQHVQLLPVPTGDYLLRISVGAYNEFKATVSAYVQRVED
ncbi:unnamed protein product [Ceratitis capitata]|uniref:(Mediterranean fruit fly) hypothetical protein n=1 Tax=Ceratitis capitata TaxID=7213 RepID=A0A811V6W5_CERCA|nr:unnamed protein product [Ceratitis capitata]